MSPGVSKLLSLRAPAPNALCQSETRGHSRLWALSGSLREASAWLHKVEPSSCSLRRLQIPVELSGCRVLLLPFCKAGLHSCSESLRSSQRAKPNLSPQREPPSGQ
ncbi:unnamed protein product [Rangifer tarandus platyrhynchus]|uniref:Uncharacterized protein n=1 Tax=Rangifer tarandus platyrhynchus TaxID=3082113 RepID=A0AC59Z0P3_RANTA